MLDRIGPGAWWPGFLHSKPLVNHGSIRLPSCHHPAVAPSYFRRWMNRILDRLKEQHGLWQAVGCPAHSVVYVHPCRHWLSQASLQGLIQTQFLYPELSSKLLTTLTNTESSGTSLEVFEPLGGWSKWLKIKGLDNASHEKSIPELSGSLGWHLFCYWFLRALRNAFPNLKDVSPFVSNVKMCWLPPPLGEEPAREDYSTWGWGNQALGWKCSYCLLSPGTFFN